MCRSIKTLFNIEPPATEDDVRAAALQFVRKISGSARPSRTNEAAFNTAVEEIARIAGGLLNELQTSAPPRDRQQLAARAAARAQRRIQPSSGEENH